MNDYEQDARSTHSSASLVATAIGQPDREVIEHVRNVVRRKLYWGRLPIDESDVEALCNQAWEELHKKAARGEYIPCVEPYWITIALRRAIDELRRNGPARRHVIDVDFLAAEEEVDMATMIDNKARIRAFLEAMREYLSDVELNAIRLCRIEDLSRPEAAITLGVSDRRIQKIADKATSKLAEPIELIREDRWCSHQMVKVRALAAGMLTPGGQHHLLAMAHLKHCSACRFHYLKLSRGASG
jgi:RNA polymerase sigma factor (sigma-70 family)